VQPTFFSVDRKHSANIFQVGISKYQFFNAKCVNGAGH